MSFEKELDFVVYGATGFTGKLVVEYINSQYSFNEIKWAMAGRNLEKLAQVKDDLNIDDSVELIEVDSNNLDSINRLTQKTKCILTTVGPYQLYGNDIVKSCAESGTDYVDLCGEPGWMHKMINEYSTKASETGARIVFWPADGPTNIGRNSIEYKGKFMGRYDLYVDPMYPQDEILVGYKGANAMDAGYVYAPYIPLQQLPTVVDPETFQPRKGLLTRYGKVQIEPYNRFYRIVRVIGPTANFLFSPFARNSSILGASVS